MSSKNIVLNEVVMLYEFTTSGFIELIDQQYTKRQVAKLTGVNNGDIYGTPLVKRNDGDLNEDDRLLMVLGYTMGALDWDQSELDCGPLLGLYDHKGWLTSFWYEEPSLKEIAAVHDGWNANYESLHHAIIFNGMNNPATREYEIEYENEATA